jgi:hypothetical protein
MKQQPEKIFRDKLHDFKMAPPPAAWDRIEGAMVKQNNNISLRNIAAAAALLIIAGYGLTSILFSAQDSIVSSSIAVDSSNIPKDTIREESDKKLIHPHLSANSQVGEHHPASSEPVTNPSLAPTVVKRVTVKSSNAKEPLLPVSVQEVIEEEKLAYDSSQREVAFEQRQLAFKAPEEMQPEPVRIVLSAKQTEEYLVIKEKDEATFPDRKSSTLKKLLKKASDLSTNQDPFGELRQKKNEFLALHFKSDKQRGQKK